MLSTHLLSIASIMYNNVLCQRFIIHYLALNTHVVTFNIVLVRLYLYLFFFDNRETCITSIKNVKPLR